MSCLLMTTVFIVIDMAAFPVDAGDAASDAAQVGGWALHQMSIVISAPGLGRVRE